MNNIKFIMINDNKMTVQLQGIADKRTCNYVNNMPCILKENFLKDNILYQANVKLSQDNYIK